MTWQYAGEMFVSIVTSPVIDLAFVVGFGVGWLVRGRGRKRPG